MFLPGGFLDHAQIRWYGAGVNDRGTTSRPDGRKDLGGHTPELDGFATTKIIREQEKTTGTQIAIIALTALAMQGDAERCLAYGTDGYVSKPIQLDELFSVIENVLASLGAKAAGPSRN